MGTPVQLPAGGSGRYFTDPRPDVLAQLPASLGRVLELGCAEGEFGRCLLERGLATSVVGVDAFVPSDVARDRLTEFVRADVDAWLSDSEARFDSVVALDVLEHLEDPWTTVRTIRDRLVDGGRFIASIPNVRYVGVTAPLLLRGDFEYRQSGILDRTHLRFFTRRSMVRLVEQADLRLEFVRPLRHPLQRRSRRAAAVLLRDHGVRQFLVSASRAGVAG